MAQLMVSYNSSKLHLLWSVPSFFVFHIYFLNVPMSLFYQMLSASNFSVFCLDSPWKVYLSELDPAVTEMSVGGLTPARTYQFRLCAVNQVGRGQYSGETQR